MREQAAWKVRACGRGLFLLVCIVWSLAGNQEVEDKHRMVNAFFRSHKFKTTMMKNLKTLFVALVLCAPLTAAAQDVVINEENFPDANFRNYLLGLSYGADGVITEEEIAGITSMYVNGGNISSLKGIEHFTALEYLNCTGNQLTALNLSNNTALRYLDCSSNQLTTLDVSNNTVLTRLECYTNQLTALDVSNNTALTELNCSRNQLTALDLSNNTALTNLQCQENQITELDLSSNTTLTELLCHGNQLTSLNVSGCKALPTLECYDNQLTSLDVSGCTALKDLYCQINQLQGESMDAFISSLPETEEGWLYVYSEYPYDNDGNVITKSQVAVAKAKGWTPYYYVLDEWGWYDWKEYEGMDDTATSIALPEIENGTAAVYTLQGQKVTTPQKGGIYIVNDKKVVVK